jgi:hypothetical protein
MGKGLQELPIKSLKNPGGRVRICIHQAPTVSILKLE